MVAAQYIGTLPQPHKYGRLDSLGREWFAWKTTPPCPYRGPSKTATARPSVSVMTSNRLMLQNSSLELAQSFPCSSELETWFKARHVDRFETKRGIPSWTAKKYRNLYRCLNQTTFSFLRAKKIRSEGPLSKGTCRRIVSCFTLRDAFFMALTVQGIWETWLK